MRRNLILLILVLAIIGIVDSTYLAIEHYRDTVPPCSTNILVDCGQVLRSQYAKILGVPLALLGVVYYFLVTVLISSIIKAGKRLFKQILILVAFFGFIFSLYLMYLQIIVIGSICLYCTLSALISILIFVLTQITFPEEKRRLLVSTFAFVYQKAVKNILFLIDAETIHNATINFGNLLGKSSLITSTNKYFFKNDFDRLKQTVNGIVFKNPIGLAAGFDYEAQLTQIFPSLDFGFESVGTITNMAYSGNPQPRLGRLPKSKSLMVNKGFKSSGAKSVSARLEPLSFDIPIGISIGRTNSDKLKTQKQSIEDIVKAFIVFEKSKVRNSYYELNISCPNLIHGNIDFYSSKKLKGLLTEIDKLKVKKPIFVKMPISESDRKTLSMLEEISQHSPSGVIFGNLQKNKNHSAFNKREVNQFKIGNFSGKPTFDRSNALIKLAYRNYQKRLTIIGCGGVFSADDAYQKITQGATLVQLITGLVYQGPQLVTQINLGLVDLLKKKGLKNVSQAIGIHNRS